jgi:hypothetical protein
MPFWNNAGKLFLESIGISTEEDLSSILLSMSMEDGAEFLIKKFVPHMSVSQVLQGIINVMSDAYKNRIPLKKGAEKLLFFSSSFYL